MNHINILNKIEKYLLCAGIFLYPIFIFLRFSNFIELPKLFILFSIFILLLFVKLAKVIVARSLSIKTGTFDLPTLLISISFLLSGLIASHNYVDSFFKPGYASFVVLAFFYYLFVNHLNKDDKKDILHVIIASVVVLCSIQIVSFFGILSLVSALPQVLKSSSFNPFGNNLNLIVFLLSILPILIYKLLKSGELAEKILFTLTSLVVSISICTTVFSTFFNKEAPFNSLNYKYGWSIAIDSLKNNPLLGLGPGNFTKGFNKFRPIEFNNETNWQLKYTQSSSLLLTILTETGLIGLITFLVLLTYLYLKRDGKNILFLSIVIVTTGIILLPVSPIIFVTLFILTGLYSKENREKDYDINDIKIKFAISSVLIILLTLLSYLGYRSFSADLNYANSIKYVSDNKGIESYNSINKAIKLNPYSDEFHLFSASINLALAENIAKKENITDTDRENISKLIQQAIREGKATVTTNPNKSSNWEALSNIYTTIITIASGADDFAVQTLNQAIILDPINPNLRIKLGSLYYSLQKYDLAVDALKLAVLAKPDLANSHYNLALAYKASGNLDKAKESMNTTLQLLGKDTVGYDQALKELQDIEELSKPKENLETIVDPQLELPEGSQI